jgi:alpha-beta hydrolase superfamily lysophospholipase
VAPLLLLLLAVLPACTPRTVPPGPGAAEPAIAEDALVTPDGARLPLQAWRPDGAPKAVIVGLHGFNDYADGFALPGRWFAQHGYALYAYDQRGFGRTAHRGLWPGTDRLVADAGTAVRLIRRRHPDAPVYLMGVSMGGAAILAAAGRERLPPVAGAILVAPAVWARQEMPVYQRWALWLTVHTVPWLKLSGEGLDRLPSDNIPMLRAFAADPQVIGRTRIDSIHGLTQLMTEALPAGRALDVPTLALYGQRDEIVPPGPTEKLWRQLDGPRHTRALYPKSWHMMLRDLHAPSLYADVAAWIDRGGRGPLPSGADGRARDALAEGGIETLDRPARIRAGVE